MKGQLLSGSEPLAAYHRQLKSGAQPHHLQAARFVVLDHRSGDNRKENSRLMVFRDQRMPEDLPNARAVTELEFGAFEALGTASLGIWGTAHGPVRRDGQAFHDRGWLWHHHRPGDQVV